MTLFDPGDTSSDAPPPGDALPAGPTRRVRLVVAYDGSGFRGFAAQPGVVTVAGTLTDAISRVVGHDVALVCAGRTDAGVHAWGQVVTFDVAADAASGDGLARLVGSVNKMCAPSVVVRHADAVDTSFDARFSAIGRRYRYSVLNTPVPDPFRAHLVWHVAEPLDLRAMRLACDPLIGEHDFSSFCRAAHRPDGTPASLVRRVFDATWVDDGDGTLQFRIHASAFCHQMVRAVVGTLVDVGRGRLRAGDIMGILAARDRHRAGQLAPPHGLCLWEVRYP
jgi:tRNA pseudouridine38-40 synthase